MKAPVATVFALLVTLALPIACRSQDGSPTPTPTAGVVTPASLPVAERVYTDPAATIRTHVDQLFLIALDANRTTGYTWQLVPTSEALAQTIGSAYAVADSARLGAGGQQIWIVRATGAGKTTLTFRYVRPFDKTASAGAKEVTFRVEVAS